MKQAVYIFFLLISFSIAGQNSGSINLREKKVQVLQPQIKIDSFSIQPFYFEVFDATGDLVPPQAYSVDFVKAILYLNDFEVYEGKELLIKYLVYPEYLRKTYQKYDISLVQKDSTKSITLLPENHYTPKPLEGLETKGYISRGFNVGNNQSLVMESGLDLKIAGKISSKLQVKAVLSDNNLPQAYAGISQSYKEFDRIYMQLIAPKWEATGGDLLLKEQADYFLKFTRKTQGLSVQMGKDSSRVRITGSYVEGQYGVNRFQGKEGNQGPYVLQGNQGESYIFVIPDSEKVYVNGKRLQRGETKDYTIQYETAEIRFNPTFPITQNMRIVVEFNYSNQHYMRYLNHNIYKHHSPKVSYTVFSFIESDAKTKTLLYSLDEEQVNLLKAAGDNLQALWVEAAQETTYSEDKILYKKVTTATQTYYEYTNENEPELYEVRFSYVGNNKGSYAIKEVVANGKIYEYVGAGNGSYDPVIRLTPPEAKRYAGFSYNLHPSIKTNLFIEGILSDTDKNLFSPIDDTDNLGGAFHLDWQQSVWQQKDKNLTGRMQYDYVHQNFNPLDPYRPVEFSRQWQLDSIFGKQHLADFGLQYHSQSQQIATGIRYFEMRDSIQALQGYGQAAVQWKQWQIQTDLQYTSQDNTEQLSALQWDQTIAYDFKKHRITGKWHSENRDKQNNGILDSLNYQYQWAELRWQKKDSSRLGYEIFYRKEWNDSIAGNQWQDFDRIDNIGFSLHHTGENHRLEWFTQYRHSQYVQQDSVKDYLNIKLQWQQYFWQRFLATQIKVESFNGNTLRDEVVFVPTPAGQGTYMWVDYNNNGIKEIDEFELAVYSDQANYIRVILPSKNYVPTLNNAYVFEMALNPEVWQKPSFWKRFYGVLRMENRHQSVQKDGEFPLVWQPENNLSQYTLWQSDWFFNRAKKKYHLHFTYQYIDQMQLLLIGQQSRQIEQYRLQTQHNFKDAWLWKQKFIIGTSANYAESYDQKNYSLSTTEIEEGVQIGAAKKTRLYSYFNYRYKENLTGDEILQAYKIGTTYDYSNSSQTLFHLDLQLIQNNMEGNAYSPVAFQMLESLQVGKNIVFTALYRKKMSSYLEMSLSYNFRLSETNPAVHTGGIQLKMIF